ncbi:RNA polymerase sigma factor (sigma-70 family) [Saccharothrix saharensis]|uniref:RNA polymerase sigma factor (Sigma-70 family) n=1 Tax=Saccharothrix saharensis TaxID=571190 RepID=A0A543JHR1_9PSEU|nr:sigma-70 family RNA polymerase sigma factor [Saccharothrix saharensis]TQM82294.1 RNA polymerase sigma factor (sigma-70 family) [Saccharothrix saharensis]
MRDWENTELLVHACRGDAAAWHEIVRRYARLVWAVPRSHRLSREDAADVCQATWLALAENLARIRRPDRLGAWLVTTTRRETLAVLRSRGREVPLELAKPVDRADGGPTPEEVALARDAGLWRAYATLTDRCREILRLAAFAPELSFTQVAAAVGVPVNSLGATRGRCLDLLRRRLGVAR